MHHYINVWGGNMSARERNCRKKVQLLLCSGVFNVTFGCSVKVPVIVGCSQWAKFSTSATFRFVEKVE